MQQTVWAIQRSVWSVLSPGQGIPKGLVVASVVLIVGLVSYIASAAKVLEVNEAISYTERRIDYEAHRSVELTSELEALRSPLNLQRWAAKYNMVPTSGQNVWRIP